MSSPSKFPKWVVLFLVVVGVLGGIFWILRPSAPAVDPFEKERTARAMTHNVELKDSALADLENRKFHEAEPQLLELATIGLGEPVGSRNWLINRIAIIGTIDEAKDIKDYAEAAEGARTALNLEWKLEPDGPVRYYLASKTALLSDNFERRLEYLHTGALHGLNDPSIWYELYQVERTVKDESIRADADTTLTTLYNMIPNNFYVLLEFMSLQARHKDAAIVTTLERARALLLPFLSDVAAESPIPPAKALADATAAAKKGDWSTVARNVDAFSKFASLQPAVWNDKSRIDRDLTWFVKTDFSDKFYRQHPFDRVLSKAATSVHFVDAELKPPLGGLTDVRKARSVDLDGDGHLGLAVLRKSSLEVYGPAGAPENWAKVAETPLPADGFVHLLTAKLAADAATTESDFVVYGPAGVRVIENRVEGAEKKRTLRSVESADLSEKTKGAVSVVTVDLDHDGALDLVVARKTTDGAKGPGVGPLSIWRNRGHFQFADVSSRSGLAEGPKTAASLAAVDWNHDFDPDIVVAGTSGSPAEVRYLQGAGEGRFQLREPPARDNSVFQSAAALALVDADANGWTDVLAAGPAGIALMTASSTQPGELNLLRCETISDFPADHLLVLDYDNDGCQDVVAWNSDSVRVFHGAGNGRFEPATGVVPDTIKTLVAADAADFDGDGDIDILAVLPDAGGGRLHLLRNEGGNANNWIDVRLAGGPAGIGLGSLLQLKSSFVCQSQVVAGPVTHFGIGNLPSADILRIVWPNGIPADIMQPAKNKVVRASPPKGGWR